jgi:hypothetical protein
MASEYASEYKNLEAQKTTLDESLRKKQITYARAEASSEKEVLLGEIIALNDSETSLRNQSKALIKKANPNTETNDKDYVFIHFILNNLPRGLIGLLLAVILSAAMSSTASELNALGSTTAMDLYKRNIKGKSPNHYLTASKWFTLLWGVVAIAIACIANLFDNLIQLVNIIGSIFYGNVLGIFLLAFFIKFVRSRSVFIAAIITQLVIIYFWWIDLMPYLWLNLAGCAIVMGIAILIEALMIKIFRKVRKKMLTENKFSKYLLYAIGEIILVMVGILLALQVNNWNENRKLRINEIATLKEVGRNLDQNIIRQNNFLENDSILLHGGEKLIYLLKEETSIYNDSLNSMFGLVGAYNPYFVIDGAYENLKLKGLDLIQDDNLKQVLIELFEQSLPELEQAGNSFEYEVANRRYDMSLAYFETDRTFFSMHPNNFDELKDNQEYFNFLTWAVAAKRLAINHRNNGLDETNKAKRLLEKYLEKIE